MPPPRTRFLALAVFLSFATVQILRSTKDSTLRLAVHVQTREHFRRPHEAAAVGTSFGSGGKQFVAAKIRTFGGLRQFHNASTVSNDRYPQTVRPCKNWVVVTTIFNPTMQAGQVAALRNWCFVVVGDKKSPERFEIPRDEEWSTPEAVRAEEEGRLVYLSAAVQSRLPYRILDHLQWNHFGRKNIGYVFAIHHGAELIYDTDDDNFLQTGDIPLERLVEGMSLSSSMPKRVWPEVKLKTGAKVYNPYYLSFKSKHEGKHVFTWPRGFPLDSVLDEDTYTNHGEHDCSALSHCSSHNVTVVQTLADNDPDVDAVYRLTRELPVTFTELDRTEWIPAGVFSPFNSQAVVFAKPALWGLLLPVSVHGRVSDIWRSYFTQRIMWDLDQNLAFSSPWVTQCRNPHSYLGDFDSELHLYGRAGELLRLLETWKPETRTLEGRIEELAIRLYEHGILEGSDVELSNAWLNDLHAIGYKFPSLGTPFTTLKSTRAGAHVTDDNCEHEVWLNSQKQPEKTSPALAKSSAGSQVHRKSTLKGDPKTARLVIGILSHRANGKLRDATRATWMTSVPSDVRVYFLLDQNSSEVAKEQAKHNDIIVINSKYSGRANHFGEKLYRWLKLALDLFPNAEAISKMDDDAYLCPRELVSGIYSKLTPLLYYGYMHKPNSPGRFGLVKRIDEAMVVLGRELATRIATRSYCPYQSGCADGSLVDTNFGGTSLGLWVGAYDDIKAVAAPEIDLHKARVHSTYKCGSTQVSFWNSIKSAEELRRIHAINAPSNTVAYLELPELPPPSAKHENVSIVLGILSAEANADLRGALRETWIPLLPNSVRVHFLLDKNTPSNSAENRTYGDIVVLDAKFSGPKNHLGEKLYLWFNKALAMYPKSTAIGKVDDDTYLCPTKLLDEINRHLSRTMYYGFLHEEESATKVGLKKRMDEAFVLVGVDLVSRVSSRTYCAVSTNCPANGLVDTNYGGTSLGLWLSSYEDVKVCPSKAISLNAAEAPLSYNCASGPVAFWNKIKSAKEVRRIHALNN